jgi:hypothetical protein
MKGSTFFKAASLLSAVAYAQEKFTHAGTGIEFWRQVIDESQTAGGLEWGYALPGAPTGSNDEYIGYIVSGITTACPAYTTANNLKAWCCATWEKRMDRYQPRRRHA